MAMKDRIFKHDIKILERVDRKKIKWRDKLIDVTILFFIILSFYSFFYFVIGEIISLANK